MIDGPKSDKLGDNIIYFRTDKPTYKKISLHPQDIDIDNFRGDEDLKAFKIKLTLNSGKNYILKCRSRDDLDDWVTLIKNKIRTIK